MKLLPKVVAGFVALSVAHQAAADVTVNFTGSTAFRSVIHSSIQAMMGGAASTKVSHNHASALNSATLAIFQGTVSGISGTTTVRCSWSGSATGIRDCAAQNDLPFLTVGTLTGATGTPLAGQTTTELGKAQLAMSDVFQSSTVYTSPALANTNVAVVPFVWVASKSAPGSLANVTPQMARALLGNGSQPLALFTGNPADAGIYLYPTGRDGGSGTRITALAEAKYGVFTPVNQWTAVTSGTTGAGNGTVTSLQVWPTSGTGSDPALAGNGGYTSGGNVSSLMGFTSTSVSLLTATGSIAATGQNVVIVSYLGTADAATAVTNGGKTLSYAGVPYSDAAVQNGSYTFWGYQHLYNKAGLTTDENSVKTKVVALIPANLGTAGIDLNTMVVGRESDGGVVGY